MHAAVTRQGRYAATEQPAWYPEQALNVQEALQAYTVGAAQAAGWGEWLGRLAPGYAADLLVLDEDPFTCSPQDLWQISPSRVMFGGEWVYVK